MLYIVDWVKIRSIHRPQCWRNEVEYLLLQESDGVACSMRQSALLLKDKTHPGISRICMAVASGQEYCRDSSLCLMHFDSINGFQCCQASKNTNLRYIQI